MEEPEIPGVLIPRSPEQIHLCVGAESALWGSQHSPAGLMMPAVPVRHTAALQGMAKSPRLPLGTDFLEAWQSSDSASSHCAAGSRGEVVLAQPSGSDTHLRLQN